MARKVGRCLRVKKKKRVISQLKEAGQFITPHGVAAVLSTNKITRGETGNKKGTGSSIARKAHSSSQNIKKKTVRSVAEGRLKRKVIQSDDANENSSSEESEENDEEDDEQPATENDLFIQQLIEMNKCNEIEGVGPLPFEEDEESAQGKNTTMCMSHSTEAARKRALVKTQVKEKLALREHLRQLKDRKTQIRRGEDARTDRRELGKYIRQLEEEQKKKHAKELLEADIAIEGEIKANMDPNELAIMKSKQKKIMRNRRDNRPTLFPNGCGAGNLNLLSDEVGDDEKVSEGELRSMFAHLTS